MVSMIIGAFNYDKEPGFIYKRAIFKPALANYELQGENKKYKS